jgi:hypothetical protein
MPSGTAASLLRLLAHKTLSRHFLKTMSAVNEHFFRLQYRAHRQPGLIPVVNVDHPLDKAIPFRPERVWTYHDFSAFWIRTAAHLSRTTKGAADFIDTIGGLYGAAAQVYRQCLSTTTRPRSFANLGCAIIQLFDPHLMCVPSLHVMVCIHTWIRARRIFEEHGAAMEAYTGQLFDRAVLITESILYLKQHSINCIPAAMYAIHCLEGELFGEEEAALFTGALLRDDTRNGEIPSGAREQIRAHITAQRRAFIKERENSPADSDWTAPLAAFLTKAGSNKELKAIPIRN